MWSICYKITSELPELEKLRKLNEDQRILIEALIKDTQRYKIEFQSKKFDLSKLFTALTRELELEKEKSQ